MEKQKHLTKRFTEALIKRLPWILLTLFLLPVLASLVWYGRQVRQQRLNHALIEAIKKNDTRSAIALLEEGADSNATNQSYIPITFKSTLADFWNRVKGNKRPKSAAFDAPALLMPYWFRITHDNPALFTALLDHGADPYATTEDGDTVLHCACHSNHAETVKVLLDHHINPDVIDKYGFTPLMLTKPACARLLIASGAKVSTRINGFTALDYAQFRQDKDLITLLEAALKKERAKMDSRK